MIILQTSNQIDLWQQSNISFKQTLAQYSPKLQAQLIHTSLGSMIAIGDTAIFIC